MGRFKCLNPSCGRIFILPGRISTERKAISFAPEVLRIIVEKPCCPFCEGLEFEEVIS